MADGPGIVGKQHLCDLRLWIEHTYSRRHRRRGLGKLTPVEFEQTFAPHTATLRRLISHHRRRLKVQPTRAAEDGDRPRGVRRRGLRASSSLSVARLFECRLRSASPSCCRHRVTFDAVLGQAALRAYVSMCSKAMLSDAAMGDASCAACDSR